MADNLPWHPNWNIIVLDPSFDWSKIIDAILCMDGMFPDFPPLGGNFSFTGNTSPIEGVDYTVGTVDTGPYGVWNAPIPKNDYSIMIVSSDHPSCQPKPPYFAHGWNKRVIIPTGAPVDVGFGLYKNIPYSLGMKPFTDTAWMGTARQYLHDIGNDSPTFEQKAWAMIYVMWRFNFRDSLFPLQPIPAHVDITGVEVTPPTGNVGQGINVKTTFTNLGEQPRTVKTYYQVIAHHQSLVASSNFTDTLQPGQSIEISHGWIITENAKKYQDLTGGEYIEICSNLNG
jgi:hypothetical protein